MLRMLAGLATLAVVVAGCSAYPSFEARLVNDMATDQEVQVEVLRGGQLVFQRDRTVLAGETWELGIFTRTEGEHDIRVHVAGRLAATDSRFFGHDEGPGGFGIHLSPDGTAEISYWHY